MTMPLSHIIKSDYYLYIALIWYCALFLTYLRDQVKLESSTHGSPPPQGKSTHGLKLKSQTF